MSFYRKIILNLLYCTAFIYLKHILKNNSKYNEKNYLYYLKNSNIHVTYFKLIQAAKTSLRFL